MSKNANFLEADNDLTHSSLRFVRNEMEENLQTYFGGHEQKAMSGAVAPPREYKIVTPKPGFCIKSFKVNDNEKFFVNICTTDEIPAPRDITEEELHAILQSAESSNYRIPMSISDPRVTKDKSNNPVDVCDIALNPQFFSKLQKSVLFKEFFLTLIAEALNDKYNVQIKIDRAIILNNRKFIGTLVQHRVRNNDVKRVLESYQIDGNKKQLELGDGSSAQHKLVQELDAQQLKQLKEKVNLKTQPEYKLRARVRDEVVEEIQAEFYLPKCMNQSDFNLDIGEDRIFLESTKHNYLFDKFVSHNLNNDGARAIFDKTSKMLQVRIPVLPLQ